MHGPADWQVVGVKEKWWAAELLGGQLTAKLFQLAAEAGVSYGEKRRFLASASCLPAALLVAATGFFQRAALFFGQAGFALAVDLVQDLIDFGI